MKLKLYTSKGEVSGDIAVKDEVFNVDIKDTLVSQAVKAHLANKRVAIAHTKDRGEVSGGGKKPWKQKGTGRARAGSSRSPIWRGGGATFAARPQNHEQKLNKKMYRAAMRSILAELVRSDRLIVVEDFAVEFTQKRENLILLIKCKSYFQISFQFFCDDFSFFQCHFG